MDGYVIIHTIPASPRCIAHLTSDHPPKVLENRYTLVARDGSPLPLSGVDNPVEIRTGRPGGLALGQGGYGVVVRAVDSMGVHRALKFFKPQELGLSSEITSTYEREIRLTNQRPFKNVIRIMDCGIGEDRNKQKYGVYVMDFVEGVSLGTFLVHEVYPHRQAILRNASQSRILYTLLFRLLDQLVEALAELHAAEVVHMDIKPQNILVLTESTDPRDSVTLRPDYKLFVTDLGAGKKVYRARKGRTRLIRTRPYFPEHLLPELSYDEGDGAIDYERLFRWGFAVDLYCLGKSLEELLFDRYRRLRARREIPEGLPSELDERDKEDFWKAILGHEFQVLELVVDELLSRRKSQIKNAEALVGVLAKISRRSAADVLSSEVLTDRYPGLQIKLPQDTVNVADQFSKIVLHPVFQRLKNIGQLALVYEIFPGATHTRYAHSLLTFDLAKRFILSLARDSMFRYLFRRQDIDTILCAALLHDLGQYPLAHSIEDLKKAADLFGIEYLQSIKYDHQLFESMARRTSAGIPSIEKIVGDLGINLEDVKRLIAKRRDPALSPQMKIGQGIINGTIDVDRLSYLHLDSYMTGVPYGRGIDLDGLLENLCVMYDGPINVGLAISESGISAAEMVLAAVYWMYRNVYWHPKNRALMAIIKHIFGALLEKGALSLDGYIEATFLGGDYKALNFLSEKYSTLEGHEEFGNPLDALLTEHQIGYRSMAEIGHSGGKQAEVYESLVHGCAPERLKDLRQCTADILGWKSDGRDGAILWDIPLKTRLHHQEEGPRLAKGQTETENATGVRLWVKLERMQIGLERGWQKIEDYSGLASQVSKEEDRQGRRVRLFVSEKVINALPKNRQNLQLLEEAILGEVVRLTDEWRGEPPATEALSDQSSKIKDEGPT